MSEGLRLCVRLVGVSEPFDQGQCVELKFSAEGCHGVHGGELVLRVPPEARALYFIGDHFSLNLRLI